MNQLPLPLPALSPALADALRAADARNLADLVRTNARTTYFRHAPVLAAFRDALHPAPDAPDAPDPGPAALAAAFRAHVPLTTYAAYLPFVARFFATPVQHADIADLFAPGLPAFIAISSADGRPRYFPKYARPAGAFLKSTNPEPEHGGRTCHMITFVYRQVLAVHDAAGAPVRAIPVSVVSAGSVRTGGALPTADDAQLQALKVPTHTSPLAVNFIAHYRTFLLMHALFALADPALEMMNVPYSTVFLDFARLLADQWDALLAAVASGVVPALDGLEPHIRAALQAHLRADPERAAQLRGIDRTAPGWLALVWPRLRLVLCVASGGFRTIVATIRHLVGPAVALRGVGFVSSESFIGLVYDADDLDLFKVVSEGDVFEYLDAAQPPSPAALRSAWELQTGARYEVVLTTRDGLWRYRLGDVIAVAGFDPADGAPLFRYAGRRDVPAALTPAPTRAPPSPAPAPAPLPAETPDAALAALAVGDAPAAGADADADAVMADAGAGAAGGADGAPADAAHTELALQDAVHAAEAMLRQIAEFTVVVDDRRVPAAYGFLIELTTDPAGVELTTQTVLAHLCRVSARFATLVGPARAIPPTIRLLRPGTFAALRARGGAPGDADAQRWLLEQVVREL